MFIILFFFNQTIAIKKISIIIILTLNFIVKQTNVRFLYGKLVTSICDKTSPKSVSQIKQVNLSSEYNLDNMKPSLLKNQYPYLFISFTKKPSWGFWQFFPLLPMQE